MEAEDLLEEHNRAHATAVGATVVVGSAAQGQDGLADVWVDAQDVAEGVEGARVESIKAARNGR